MLLLNWPLVFITTIFLYAVVILSLPFSALYATLFLFALIAFWSRLPGIGIPSNVALILLYSADLVDVFSAIIAVNIGGVEGAVFSACINLWSRVCGVFPSWSLVLEDTIAQVIVCLLIPFFYAFTGHNILAVVVIYSIMRILIAMPLNFITYRVSLPQFILEWLLASIALFIINSFYGKVFGDFFSSLLKSGMAFSWILFLVATAVILIFYLSVFRNSESISAKPLVENVVKIIKARIIRSARKHATGGKHPLVNTELDELKEIRKNLYHSQR